MWSVVRKLFPLVLLFSALETVESFAAWGNSTGVGFHVSGKLNVLYGETGTNDGQSKKRRNILIYGAGGLAALTYDRFLLGGSFDYNLWRQITAPSELDGYNTQGTEVYFGAFNIYN